MGFQVFQVLAGRRVKWESEVKRAIWAKTDPKVTWEKRETPALLQRASRVNLDNLEEVDKRESQDSQGCLDSQG